jgi:hypothetical protein
LIDYGGLFGHLFSGKLLQLPHEFAGYIPFRTELYTEIPDYFPLFLRIRGKVFLGVFHKFTEIVLGAAVPIQLTKKEEYDDNYEECNEVSYGKKAHFS